MNIKWILLAVSIAIVAVPLCGAFVLYSNNLTALVMPEDIESLMKMPEFEYVGNQTTNPLKPVLKFRIENPYSMSLKLNSISAKVYCSDHNVTLGYARENASVTVSPKSSAIVDLVVNFSSPSDIYTNHLHMNNLYIDLRELDFDIQGIKIHSKETMMDHMGPFPTP